MAGNKDGISPDVQTYIIINQIILLLNSYSLTEKGHGSWECRIPTMELYGLCRERAELWTTGIGEPRANLHEKTHNYTLMIPLT